MSLTGLELFESYSPAIIHQIAILYRLLRNYCYWLLYFIIYLNICIYTLHHTLKRFDLLFFVDCIPQNGKLKSILMFLFTQKMQLILIISEQTEMSYGNDHNFQAANDFGIPDFVFHF